MKILNYTGKRIGLTNRAGNPIEVIPSDGHAHCEIEIKEQLIIGRTPIYNKDLGKVRGLPAPDLNLEKMYIVTADVAEAIGHTRKDLIVPANPFHYEGATFYKLLLRAS